MKWILSLFLCLSASAQLPVIPCVIPSGATRWWPTNATTGKLEYWAELTPIDGTFGGVSGTIYPAGDNGSVKIWTNFANGTLSGTKWTADQTLHPTNFISGGGGSGTAPRNFFKAASTTRMTGPGQVATNKFTFIIVANCTRTSGTDVLLTEPPGPPFIEYTSKALAISQGTTLTSSTTMGTGFYVITAVFSADANSHIDTNGVNMVTGNAGSTSGTPEYIGNGGTDGIFNGNICRIWGWSGVLSAGDLASAVAQCRTDFGI